MARDAGILGRLSCPLAFGLLRLGTEDRPTREEAISLIHQVLDAGIRILDTADTYCLNEKDLHYGERLALDAVQSWSGPQAEVNIITKVGMARPKGRWVPAGNARQLREAVEGSLKALKCERLFLVQLHAKDTRVPYEETLIALAQLQREGKIEHLGLCNVNPPELRQAQRHFEVMSVQNELSVMDRSAASSGMLELTQQLGIPFLAYRPLGGHAKVEKLEKNRALAPLVKRHSRPPHELALAAVLASKPHVIPLFGARRLSSLRSSLNCLCVELDEADLSALYTKISFEASPEALAAIAPRVVPSDLPKLLPNQGPVPGAKESTQTPAGPEEVVLLMGIQGAGKSELVEAYEAAGYARLNRDLLGGKLDDLIPQLQGVLEGGARRVVLDNTYPTRISRGPVIATAHAHRLPVRCRYLATSAADARFNVALRMFKRYGRMLGPEDMKELSKSDPNLPPPVAMQRWLDSFEPPALDEGFSVIDELPFVRRADPQLINKGLLLDVDGTLRKTKSGELYPTTPEDIELLPGRREVLQGWLDRGYRLYFVSNQSGVASGKLTLAAADACFARTVELLGLPVEEVAYCPHSAFPVGCFCRKPMTGLGVQLMIKHQLSPKELVMVGDMDSDEAFARGLGAQYFDAAEFFGQ
ncbi:MAG: HAD-IIIA family hydrolase [Pirellulaceae bacterium]|nr:HAD-IIIA family hydrolase [Pirellulaceae bacterium]